MRIGNCGGFEEKSAATRSREAKKAKVEQTIKNGAKSGKMVAAKLDNLELEIKVAMISFELILKATVLRLIYNKILVSDLIANLRYCLII